MTNAGNAGNSSVCGGAERCAKYLQNTTHGKQNDHIGQGDVIQPIELAKLRLLPQIQMQVKQGQQ